MILEYLASLGFPERKTQLYIHILKVRRFRQKDYFKKDFPLKICYPTYMKYLDELVKKGYIYKGLDERSQVAFAPLENTNLQNGLIQKRQKYQKCLDVWQSGDTEESLRILGLDNDLIRIYQMLAFQKKTITETAKELNKKRNSLYWDIDRLKQFDLAYEYQKGKLKGVNFIIKDKLPDLFQQKLDEANQTISDFQRYLPTFADLERYGQKPEVIYLEGEEEVEQVFEQMLNAKTEILNIGPKEGTQKYLSGWNEKWIPRFVEKEIRIRCIEYSNKRRGEYKEQSFIYRYLPEKYNPDYDLWFFDNKILKITKVVNTGFMRPCAFLTKSNLFYKEEVKRFEMEWEYALQLHCTTAAENHS